MIFLSLVLYMLGNTGRYSEAFSSVGGMAKLVLFMPGSIIIPLLVGIAIGVKVGNRSKTAARSARMGMLNGIYASIIYIVAMVIVYEVMVYVSPSLLPTVNFMLLSWGIQPIVEVIVTSTIFSIVLSAMKNSM
jgi:hypothetical protein